MSQDQAARATVLSSEIAEMLEPVFAGMSPEIVGAVLGQLLAKLIAGHHPLVRDEALKLVLDMMHELVPIEIEMMIESGQCGPEWREAQRQ